jgi:polyisoprenoid-binding protein YceI
MKYFLIILSVSIPFMHVQAESLHVQFVSKTNIPGMSIEGTLEKPIKLHADKVEIPIKSIKTGMESRDDHMYKEIFKNKNIRLSFVNFNECIGKESCKAEVNLEMAGRMKKLTIPVKKKEHVKLATFKVKLTDFQIVPPEKFGVVVEDDVEVSIEVHKD